MAQDKYHHFHAAKTSALQMGDGIWVYTSNHKNSRNKKQKFSFQKNDEDVGMKKAQKQDIIQNGRIFGILYPFLHSTSYP